MKHIDDDQLQEIYTRHGAALVLYARQWCELPDDALQEALVELVQLDFIPLDVAAWLFKVVRYKAMNFARSERRRASHQRRAVEERDDWFISPHETQAEAHELECMLERLPGFEREIVIARIWGELSFEKISLLTGKPSSTVHRHFKIALAQLKCFMEDCDGNSVNDGGRDTNTKQAELR